MLKKLLPLLLVLSLGFSLVSCDEEYEDYDDDEDDDSGWFDDDDDDDDDGGGWFDDDDDDDDGGGWFDDDDDDDDDGGGGWFDDDDDDDDDGGGWFDDDDDSSHTLIGESGDPDQTWAIYWYLCGSDLESEIGSATDDLAEMMEASLSDQVQVIIQTGGASAWMNDMVDASVLERYRFSSDGMELVDQQPLANMGDPQTLAEFLYFCEENYPADRTAVIFWNHGGGSVSGASFDENFDYDSLTLGEFHQAFEAVYDLSTEHPPVDVIGFDTCLMATIDTAYTFADIGRYLVASEEWESSIGWTYDAWLTGLSEDPGMDGARLGQVICDTYMEGCEEYDVEDESTLSVVDLGRVLPLVSAYDKMGAEALTYALEDPAFFSSFGRAAVRSENYGGNTRDQGYANMVDLGHLAQNCTELLPQMAQEVLDGLKTCVLYNVHGDYRENSSGLSCYFSYNGDTDDLYGYRNEGCSDSFKYFFDYGILGDVSEEGYAYMQEDLGYAEDTVPVIPDLTTDDTDYPLYLDEEGYVTLELDQDTVHMLKGVYFQLAYADLENDIMLLLGQDNDLYADWDAGIFKDNFRGVWGSLDGYLVYMEVSYECDEYTLYSVPILLNGEEYNLRVIYDYEEEAFFILGARKGLEDNGMADKNLVQLRPGDEITTIHYVASVSGDDAFEATTVETLTVTENTSFYEVDMGDGVFFLMFELIDARNNLAYSDMVQFTVSGDAVDVEIIE